MKKIIAAIVLVLLIAGAIWYFQRDNSSVSPSSSTTPTASASPTASPSASPKPSTLGIKVDVTYTDSGYSPQSVTIPAGGTVIFHNNSSRPMWTASNPHPIHTGYPEGGGCIGSAFDSCQGVSVGGTYAFTFTKVGTWGYHNHVHATDTGKVVVQ